MESPIDGLSWPMFWVYVVGWVLGPTALALLRALGTSRRHAARWLVACGVRPTDELIPAAIEYVRWTRWWRSAGFIAGWWVAISGPAVTGDARNPWFPGHLGWVIVLTGYLVGVLIGELARPRPQAGGARLVWRRALDAIPRWVLVLTVASLIVGLMVAWLGELGGTDEAVMRLEPPQDWLIWSLAFAVTCVGWIGVVLVMRRPLRGGDEVELWLEEARRVSSARAIVGAAAATAFLVANTLVAALPLLRSPDVWWSDMLFGFGLGLVGPLLAYSVFRAIADLASPIPAWEGSPSEARRS